MKLPHWCLVGEAAWHVTHRNSFRKALIGGRIFCVSVLVALVGYTSIGWSLVNSFYMVVITIFGVGYGKVRPIENLELKIFTAAIIIAGCSSGIFVVGLGRRSTSRARPS